MAMRTRAAEIRSNFDAFESLIGSLMTSNHGEYVLMRDGSVVEIFPKLADAISAAHSRFDDEMFSIQEVADAPIDLGFFSHANPHGTLR